MKTVRNREIITGLVTGQVQVQILFHHFLAMKSRGVSSSNLRLNVLTCKMERKMYTWPSRLLNVRAFSTGAHSREQCGWGRVSRREMGMASEVTGADRVEPRAPLYSHWLPFWATWGISRKSTRGIMGSEFLLFSKQDYAACYVESRLQGGQGKGRDATQGRHLQARRWEHVGGWANRICWWIVWCLLSVICSTENKWFAASVGMAGVWCIWSKSIHW